MPNGAKEIIFPDGTVKTVTPSGEQTSVFPDGTTMIEYPDGRKVPPCVVSFAVLVVDSRFVLSAGGNRHRTSTVRTGQGTLSHE
jgi:hypothetical protein